MPDSTSAHPVTGRPQERSLEAEEGNLEVEMRVMVVERVVVKMRMEMEIVVRRVAAAVALR